jgi:mannan endo-1,4-beta-mannosidase
MRPILNLFLIFLISWTNKIAGQEQNIKPVSPNASAEATALLKLYYNLSGRNILTGQHNYPNIKDRNSLFAYDYIGKDPVIFSTDWGFEKDGNTDSYLARPDIVKEAIRQHQNGAIITICWHAVPPTANEPVTFRPLPGAKSDSLASIQGQLTDRQFKDLLTPGTKLYNHWCSQVDSIAKYLEMLKTAHVPVLWRPYHEMNGNWFWWGGRQGKYSTVMLYQQLFDRLVNFHKLNNLVWMWNVDRPNNANMNFRNFYPGNNYLDIVSLDVYHNDFKKDYYDSLLVLAKGKPIAFGEVGNPPSPEIFEQQPLWASYVVWAGMVRNTSTLQYNLISHNSRYIFKKDEDYYNFMADYWNDCNLQISSNLNIAETKFSGTWIFNEDRSKIENTGASSLPYRLEIIQNQEEIKIYKTIILEYADNRIDSLTLSLDGKEYNSEMWNTPMITTAKWNSGRDTLNINSTVKLILNGKNYESTTDERWYLENNKRNLVVLQHSNSFWGERNVMMVFDRIFTE